MRIFLALFFALTLAAPLLAQAPRYTSPDLATRRQQLDTLLHEQWEYTLRTNPEFASILGDRRYNDKLSDFSQHAIDADLRQARTFFEKFSAVDTAGFPVQEQLNQRLMVRNLKQQLDEA